MQILNAGSSFEPTRGDVFSNGDGGFVQIRIPSLVVARNGTLLAFAEGRDTIRSDQGSNKILLRSSHDRGSTWGPLRVLDDQGASSLNNPCAVVDQVTGAIFLFYQCIPPGMTETSPLLKAGSDPASAYTCRLLVSGDNGLHWAPPVDVTSQTKRAANTTTFCSGPGVGIQLTRGAHKGRLLIPFNEGPYFFWNDYAVYSDDHGRTWRMGTNAPGAIVRAEGGEMRSQVNEVQFAELSDGSVLLNSRRFAGNKTRKQAISRDGGETWSAVIDVPDLRDPSCMGSTLRYSFGPQRRNLLLFSGPDAEGRENGTIHASFDDGKTWPIRRVLEPGEFAYSVLTWLPRNQVGCLYETDSYKKIVFARFSLKWLLGP